MKINKKDARKAGKISGHYSWTDEELLLISQTMELVVAFLEGKGEQWSLATFPLRKELDDLRKLTILRKSDR